MNTMGGANPNYNLLLTSAGPTTEAIQERMLEMALSVKTASQLHKLRILRVADGWQDFGSEDGVPLNGRIESRVEATTSRLWSKRYIGHVLGKASITTEVLGRLNEDEASKLIDEHDFIVIPGGNTWQTMRGIQPHEDAIHKSVQDGMPYVGESAGSIVAGLSTSPALLPPADASPQDISGITSGLGLVNFNIVVHATGQSGKFDIPGILSKVSSTVLGMYETSQEDIDSYISNNSATNVLAINNTQAISVTHGIIEKI